MALPPGAYGSSDTPTPTAGHAGVIGVSIAIAAGLITGSAAIGGGGLLTLLVLLLGGFALVIPLALVATLWQPARGPVRVLLALAAAVCALLLVLAVVRVVEVAPALLGS
ncbi:hypothetical protein [Pseudonocardia kunmingensis]|nr:hypothetical protein [Pseudonocardia kunmingensis]